MCGLESNRASHVLLPSPQVISSTVVSCPLWYLGPAPVLQHHCTAHDPSFPHASLPNTVQLCGLPSPTPTARTSPASILLQKVKFHLYKGSLCSFPHRRASRSLHNSSKSLLNPSWSGPSSSASTALILLSRLSITRLLSQGESGVYCWQKSLMWVFPTSHHYERDSKSPFFSVHQSQKL